VPRWRSWPFAARGRAALLSAAAAATALLLGLQFSVLAPGRPDAVERMAALSPRTARRRAAGIAARVHAQPHLLHGLKQLDSWTVAGRAVSRSDGRVLVVLLERDLGGACHRSSDATRVLARVRHLNTANLRLRSVLNPDPDHELETVVLANRSALRWNRGLPRVGCRDRGATLSFAGGSDATDIGTVPWDASVLAALSGVAVRSGKHVGTARGARSIRKARPSSGATLTITNQATGVYGRA
jgi:hypothetical protein